MGMTIDKAIDMMERYEMYGVGAQKDGRNKAIKTMRKYQQIQKIIEYPDIQEDVLKFKAICEVVKDGNDS